MMHGPKGARPHKIRGFEGLRGRTPPPLPWHLDPQFRAEVIRVLRTGAFPGSGRFLRDELEALANKLEEGGARYIRYLCPQCGCVKDTVAGYDALIDPAHAYRERRAQARRYAKKVEECIRLSGAPWFGSQRYALKMITLTWPTSGDWHRDVQDAVKYRKDVFGARGLLGTDKFPHAFAIVFVEFGEKGGNPHLHALWFGPFISQRWLSEQWCRITGGRGYVVDIRRIRNVNQGVNEIVKLCNYATKYGKALDALRWVSDWAAFRFASGSHMRRVEQYGRIRGVPYEIPVPPDQICPECGAVMEAWEYWDREGLRRRIHSPPRA